MKNKIYSLLLPIMFFVSANASTISKPVSSQRGFIENKGQIIDQNNQLNPSVLYLYNGNGLHVQLKQTGFSYEVWKIAKGASIIQTLAASKKLLPEADSIYIHRIDISFVGANPNAIITANEPASDYINYYTTGTPEVGVINVHHYKKVLYQNIYNNIDVEFILNDERNCGNFKYNFIVRPGGNVNDIQLNFDGANATSLTNDGHVIIETAYGNIDENIPSTYQLDANNNQQTIIASFTSILQNPTSNSYGLKVGKYDPTKTLIIDPVPWATYFGGSSDDDGYGISTDANGNVLITGNTKSSSAIATSGAYQTSYAGAGSGGGYGDAFIAKFNNSGSIQWATYYGGSGDDRGYAIAIDTSENVLITGSTGSTSGMATSGAYQTTYGGLNYDAFVAKFNSSGSRIWGTYYGGAYFDYGQGVTTDISGNVFITGYTSSSNGIASSGSYQSTNGGGTDDAFVVKFNSSGSRQWGTYYGGSLWDVGNGIAIDASGNVLVVGQTSSTSGIASSGGYQSTYGGGTFDAFIAKFSTSGSLLWATYYGGSLLDIGYGIVTDTSGNVLITGNTTSTSAIASSGAYQTSLGGNADAFVAKFNSSGSRQWATYYGGSSDDVAFGITIELSGNILITGYTLSSAGIATAGAYQTSYGGGSSFGDAFVAKFSTSGSRLWATYYGGGWDDFGRSIAVDASGNTFITGNTNSPTTIATSGAYQTTYGAGPYDAFIAAFTTNGSLPVQLVSFEVKPISNGQEAIGKVLCTWQTASELNNDYFEVERSIDNSQWIVAGKVKGNGTSNVVNSYQFADNSLSSMNSQPLTIYYRLKQVDFDAKSTLSEVRVINLNQPSTNWNIYPNPTTNELHIETTGTEKLTAQVFDITGKQILENILFTSSTTINTSSLHEGMYFVRITVADGVVVKIQKVAVVR